MVQTTSTDVQVTRRVIPANTTMTGDLYLSSSNCGSLCHDVYIHVGHETAEDCQIISHMPTSSTSTTPIRYIGTRDTYPQARKPI